MLSSSPPGSVKASSPLTSPYTLSFTSNIPDSGDNEDVTPAKEHVADGVEVSPALTHGETFGGHSAPDEPTYAGNGMHRSLFAPDFSLPHFDFHCNHMKDINTIASKWQFMPALDSDTAMDAESMIH
jgi:hypothetical protein